jgi:hypothetical protein
VGKQKMKGSGLGRHEKEEKDSAVRRPSGKIFSFRFDRLFRSPAWTKKVWTGVQNIVSNRVITTYLQVQVCKEDKKHGVCVVGMKLVPSGKRREIGRKVSIS